MRLRHGAAAFFGAIFAMHGTDAAPLDEHLWKDRLLVISGPAESGAVEEQRRIYRSAARSMSERHILLVEALGGSVRSRQLRAKLSADGKRFQVFLVGKDGHTALSSNNPISAEYLFGKVDAMPMRRDEMRRSR
jgi:Domain of unknown function (DUF4174)